jgi:DNA-3-methyladenine glycosylase I
MLVLEGNQAGLSWLVILNKRATFREAFDGFDPEKIALYDDKKIEELMGNAGIIRNRLKIEAAISNAKVYLDVVKKHGSLDTILWEYVNNTPIVNHVKKIEDIVRSPL